MNSFLTKIQDKARFTEYLYFATVGLNAIYILFKYLTDPATLWANVLFVAGTLVALYLLRRGHSFASRVVYVIIAHFAIFFSQLGGPSTSSIGVYFVVLILITQILFGYKHRYLAVAMNFLSLVLCVVSVVWALDHSFSKEYVLGEAILNFTISGIVTALSFLFQNYNHHLTHLKLMEGHANITRNLEEIKKTNAELDKFVYSVSHDIRAPLTSIVGLVNLAKFSTSEQELRELIKKIGYSANSLSKFTIDILDYSRNSRLSVDKHPIVLKKLINEVQTDQFLADPSAHSIMLYTNFDEHLVFNGDYYRLKMVLSNLYSNSVKYRDQTKEYSFIKIDARKTDEYLTITYADNGIGILPERLTNIFNMFYRGTELSKGSGLGLYILKEAVEKMEGAVSVCAEPGQGTIFTIAIPVEAHPGTAVSQ